MLSIAIQFGLTKGRYPEKSVRIMLNLLQNAKTNDESETYLKIHLLIKQLKEEEEHIVSVFNKCLLLI